MRNLVVVATALGGALGGLYVLSKRRAAAPPALPPRPPNEREYHDRLANRLETVLSYGDKATWEEISEECRRAGRDDLPGHVRRQWPEWSERLDRR